MKALFYIGISSLLLIRVCFSSNQSLMPCLWKSRSCRWFVVMKNNNDTTTCGSGVFRIELIKTGKHRRAHINTHTLNFLEFLSTKIHLQSIYHPAARKSLELAGFPSQLEPVGLDQQKGKCPYGMTFFLYERRKSQIWDANLGISVCFSGQKKMNNDRRLTAHHLFVSVTIKTLIVPRYYTAGLLLKIRINVCPSEKWAVR